MFIWILVSEEKKRNVKESKPIKVTKDLITEELEPEINYGCIKS